MAAWTSMAPSLVPNRRSLFAWSWYVVAFTPKTPWRCACNKHKWTVICIEKAQNTCSPRTVPRIKTPPGLMDVHAIRRMAAVEEVAAGILFLSGASAAYITGSVLDVNGGYLA